MSVTVVPGSVRIIVLNRPQVQKPIVPFTGTPASGRTRAKVFAGFACSSGISLLGEMSLDGDPDDISECTVGFIQVQWIETFWMYYRGKTNTDGGMLVQAGRPPARRQQACRDCDDGHGFFINKDDARKASRPISPPVIIRADLDDLPFHTALLGQVNGRTGQTNLLHEAQVESHFCSILSFQDGAGKFNHQASIYWNVRWQAVFQPEVFDDPFNKPWRVTPVARGNSAAVNHVIMGPPTDHRFTRVITDPAAPICNEELRRTLAKLDNFLPDGDANPLFAPRTRHESPVWTNFDVRR
jgi:hypothetical protein